MNGFFLLLTDWESLLNYGSFEWWRLFNLIVFVAALYLLLRRPLSNAFRSRREGIRRELAHAEQEKSTAAAKLQEVESRLARLDEEISKLREQSQHEAAEERRRITASIEEDAQKIREAARREIEMAGSAARQELKRYAAEQTVLLAGEVIKRDIGAEDDRRLISNYVQELEGMGH